jgi:NTP pyrophosphatase (non-canonical NTP hydrolase)
MINELDEYQQEAIKTSKPMSVENMNKYCTIKICEESGEIASIVGKHYYHNKELNLDKLKEECGDLLWYLANITQANGFSLSEIATYNIQKLRKRHGEKYNSEFYKQ